MPSTYRSKALILIGVLQASALPLFAQETDPETAPEDEVVRREELDELRLMNQDLSLRLGELEATIRDSQAYAPEKIGLQASYEDVQATFQILGDVGFAYGHPKPNDLANSAFAFGSLDFLVSAQIGDSFHFLSETVITGLEKDIDFDQERLWGSWANSDAFYAKLGLEHSPISYWNRRYHHGRWLELTIQRPLLARFEGDPNGFLPLHNMGMELGGQLDAGVGRLEWISILSNGRGPKPTDTQETTDFNNEKSVVLSVSLTPDAADNVTFGAAAQYDRIPEREGAADPDLHDPTDALVLSTYAVGTFGPIESIVELAFLQEENQANDKDYDHISGYLQIAYPIEAFTPYARFDFKNMDSGDPYLAQDDKDLDRWEQVLGVRYDLNMHAALKFEVRFGETDERKGSGSIDEDDFVGAGFQLSWAI